MQVSRGTSGCACGMRPGGHPASGKQFMRGAHAGRAHCAVPFSCCRPATVTGSASRCPRSGLSHPMHGAGAQRRDLPQAMRYTVLFSRGECLHAVLAPSNHGVRRGLMDMGVSFSMPLALDDTWWCVGGERARVRARDGVSAVRPKLTVHERTMMRSFRSALPGLRRIHVHFMSGAGECMSRCTGWQ